MREEQKLDPRDVEALKNLSYIRAIINKKRKKKKAKR